MEDSYEALEAGFTSFYRGVTESLYNQSYEEFCDIVPLDEQAMMELEARFLYAALCSVYGQLPDVEHYKQLATDYRMMQSAHLN